MNQFKMVATTLMGLEDVLAKEITDLGGENVQTLKRAVSFEGNEKLLYTANIALRTALRVLVPIDDFFAYKPEELYKNIGNTEWEKIIRNDQTFSIDATTSGVFFKHSKYAALTVKDAIVDRIRDRTKLRPSVDTENPDIRINVHIKGEEVIISLDSSGQSLDRRGYRLDSNEAPLNEVLAAGIILLSGWKPEIPFYDPMSGSGTFSIEAAMMATNTAPNLGRGFCFENWRDFKSGLFQEVIKEQDAKFVNSEAKIYANDLLTSSVELILENAKRARMENFITIKREDFFFSETEDEAGVLVINPPYGERMKLEQTNEFYAKMGDTLKQKYSGFNAWIISSNMAALKKVGLRATSKIDLMNGGLEARLNGYELFKGTRFS